MLAVYRLEKLSINLLTQSKIPSRVAGRDFLMLVVHKPDSV